MKVSGDRAAYFCAGFTIFLWSSAFPGVKYALEFYSPGALMLFRFIIASLALLIIGWLKKVRLPSREDIPAAIAGGAAGIFLYTLLFNVAMGMLQSGLSSFIVATAPIFTMLLSCLILKERITAKKAFGVSVSAFGMLLVAISQFREFSFNIGIILLLVAAALVSGYNIIQRKISYKYTPLECTTYYFVFATVLMLVFLPELLTQIGSASAEVNAIVIYLGLFPSSFAYLSWNYALGKISVVTKVTNFMYLTPFAATLLSFLFLHEVMAPMAFAGGVIIISGMVLANNSISFVAIKSRRRE